MDKIAFIIIPYSPIPSIKSKVVLAPMLPVIFIQKGNILKSLALVDSGASSAVISTVMAEELGIDWQKVKPIGGVSVGVCFGLI